MASVWRFIIAFVLSIPGVAAVRTVSSSGSAEGLNRTGNSKTLLRLGTTASLHKVATKAPAAVGSCTYVAPKDCPSSQGWQGMESLTDASWKATKGEADGKHMLLYAYGKLFDGKGQIGAWKYNDNTQFIEYYYSKTHCDGMCSDCCDGGGGNEPGFLSAQLNPSASGSWGSYKLVTKFKKGDTVDLPFGSMTLAQDGDKWRLEQGGCFLDHVYTCTQSDYVPVYLTSNGGKCDVEPGAVKKKKMGILQLLGLMVIFLLGGLFLAWLARFMLRRWQGSSEPDKSSSPEPTENTQGALAAQPGSSAAQGLAPPSSGYGQAYGSYGNSYPVQASPQSAAGPTGYGVAQFGVAQGTYPVSQQGYGWRGPAW